MNNFVFTEASHIWSVFIVRTKVGLAGRMGVEMSRLPLVLSVKSKNWRMLDDTSEQADTEFRRVREKALERDKRTCVFCGFRALAWQEVHHKNDDHADNRLENLLTICIYCHMCQHIGRAGRFGEAVLIWAPEIGQAQLHHVVRAIQVTRREVEEARNSRMPRPDTQRMVRQMSDAAEALFARLRGRQAQAEEIFGTSDPLELGNVMLQMPDELYAKRAEFLQGLRLLPLGVRMQEGEDIMPKIVDSWCDRGGPFANLRPQTWIGLAKSYLK